MSNPINVAEISKLSLASGDTLVVKLIGDFFTEYDMEDLKIQLERVFPNNKVMAFVLPSGSDLKFEKIQTKPKSLCSDPISFCADCSCGKKETFEGNSELPPSEGKNDLPDEPVTPNASVEIKVSQE